MIQKNDAAKTIWHILEIADLLKKYGDLICAVEGITSQQWLLLLYLAGDPNIPYFERERHLKPLMASELAEAFNVSRPNITNLLNGLIKKGLITQVEDSVDRRKKRLQLSAKGIEIVEKLETGRTTFNQNLFESLNTSQQKQLLAALSTVNQTIIDHFSGGGHK